MFPFYNHVVYRFERLRLALGVTVGQIEKADFAEEKDKKHAKEVYPFNQSAVFLM